MIDPWPSVSASNLEQRSPFHAFSSLAARAEIIDPDVIPDKVNQVPP